MNPYKEHALKLDKAFKRARANYLEAFAELTEAKEAYDKASSSDRPEVFSGERAARIASTKANYLYAENIFKNASRNIWDDYENTVSKITEEFNEAAASYYSVKPELVDDNALSLLNSGIMTPEDVFRMSDKYSNNPTMRRLIADRASKMADDTKFEGSRASLLRFSAELAHEKDDIIKSWDSLVATASRYAGYKRTNYGPDYVISMNRHWDEVSENINNL